MIKLERPERPIELSEECQALLTQEYKDSKKPVWLTNYIKNALSIMSSGKCAFCETLLHEESKYLEVEHFHHKNLYQDEVVEWSNLLPSCKRCNAAKGVHDTKIEPIINPSEIDPRLHLYLNHYRMQGKDELGKMTISVLNLNDQERMVTVRFKIGDAILKKIEEFIDYTDAVIQGVQTSTRRKNAIKQGITELLENSLNNREFCATKSTILLTDPNFEKLKLKLISQNLWTAEHIELEEKLRSFVLK